MLPAQKWKLFMVLWKRPKGLVRGTLGTEGGEFGQCSKEWTQPLVLAHSMQGARSPCLRLDFPTVENMTVNGQFMKIKEQSLSTHGVFFGTPQGLTSYFRKIQSPLCTTSGKSLLGKAHLDKHIKAFRAFPTEII